MARMTAVLEAGDYIANCEIVRELGRGAAGRVYLAEHQSLQLPVAIKILSPTAIEEDRELPDRFMREAQIAARITHENIVSVKDAGIDEKTDLFYMVQEYVDGGSLRKRLDLQTLTLEDSFTMLEDITEALVAIGDYDVIHRDIKPDNILINTKGRAKLADLGIARHTNNQSVNITRTGTALGTPAYMSPQHAHDSRGVDPRDDIYSLGATFYECMTGFPPFQGTSALNIVSKVLTQVPVDPRQYKPTLPLALVAICLKMMTKERDERYDSARQLMSELRSVQSHNWDRGQGLLATEFLRRDQEKIQPPARGPESRTPDPETTERTEKMWLPRDGKL